MLETNRLILRNFEPTDLNDLFELTSNKKICSMSGLVYIEDKDMVDVVLKNFMKRKHQFAIVLKETNKVIGIIELMDYIDCNEKLYQGIEVHNGAKEIVFILNENYWGKGIMAEATNKIFKYAFNSLNVPQILGGNYIDNKQSGRFQEKIGLKKVGEIDYFRTVENMQTRFVQRTLKKEEYLKDKST